MEGQRRGHTKQSSEVEWRTIELPVSVALGELGRALTLLRGIGELTKVKAEIWRDLGQDQREGHKELLINVPLGCPTSTSIGKPGIHECA